MMKMQGSNFQCETPTYINKEIKRKSKGESTESQVQGKSLPSDIMFP